MTRITFDRVSKSFDTVQPLREVSFTIEPKEFFVLVGPSGSGKSTLLRMVAGLEEVSSGNVLFDGEVMNNVPPRLRDVGMVFQNYALYPHLTVSQNLGFPLSIRRESKQHIAARVGEIAELLNITDLLERKPRQLSGGQRQRVAVGRAIIRKPRVFLFDEPLSNLDAQLRVHMRTELRQLQRALGITTIYVTHDQVEAMTMADRMAILNEGTLHQIATPQEVYRTPATVFVARFCGSPSMNILANSTIGVRPEDFVYIERAGSSSAGSLTAAGSPDTYAYTVQGSVENIEYIGHEWLSFVRTPEALVCVRTLRAPAQRIGDLATLGVSEAGLHRFDAAGKRL